MQTPKWIIENQKILSQLRLDRFPVKCEVKERFSWSRFLEWRQTITITIFLNDSLTGLPRSSDITIILFKSNNLKDKILNSLLAMMEHEVREGIQFEDSDGVRSIPFDPHT